MPQRIEDRVRPITPQLAWRVAVLGGIAFVLFGIVFFRLWYLQVLSGQDYVSQASENRLRKERIEAPRGNIVDRNGETLVETKRADGRGLELVSELARAQPAACVIVLTSYASEWEAWAMRQAGAADYVLKDIGTDMLVERIKRLVIGGE